MDDEDRRVLDKKWDKVHLKIKDKNPDFVEPAIPFRSSCLIKDFNPLYAVSRCQYANMPRSMTKKSSLQPDLFRKH